jgi:hypothetical protein
MPIKSWRPERVKAAIMDELVANGEIAGKFGETEARTRLLAIKEPEWGAGYREKVVARLLTNLVERGRNEVVIRIGVAESKSRKGVASRKHGFYIELGSKTAAAQPFLRPAVFENAGKIVALLSGK